MRCINNSNYSFNQFDNLGMILDYEFDYTTYEMIKPNMKTSHISTKRATIHVANQMLPSNSHA